jgi:SAM-dependent methyltransferase
LNPTIAYYDRNSQQFYEETVQADMSALYKPFLELVPPNGRILDAGCGSGRDSLYFIRNGYQVEAFDASAEMCRLASSLIGRKVDQKTFDGLEWNSEFDGIWACASLLHVSRDSIDAVLERLGRALKHMGILFVSFKFRDYEWEQDGRVFNGYSEETFRVLIERHPELRVISIWVSDDARPNRRGEKWLNSLLQFV